MQLSRIEKEMRHFLQFFIFLFILSIFVGVLHQLTANHHHDGTCEICLISHAPALLIDNIIIAPIEIYFEDYCISIVTPFYQAKISLRNRSPPLS